MDAAAVDDAIREIDTLVRADGASVALVSADPAAARVEVALDLTGVDCLECVVPPPFLRQMLERALAERIRGRFELVVHDPRC